MQGRSTGRFVTTSNKSQERVLGEKAMSESLECIGSESNMQIPSETRSKPHTLRTKHNSREWRVGELVRSSMPERYNVCCVRVGSASCDARPQTNPPRESASSEAASPWRSCVRRLAAAVRPRVTMTARARRRCFGNFATSGRGVSTSCKYLTFEQCPG